MEPLSAWEVRRASGALLHPRVAMSGELATKPRRSRSGGTGEAIMHVQDRHWLDYDPVALAVLVIGIGLIELLALSI
jgi:hypothetical protein